MQADQLLRERSYPVGVIAVPPKLHPHVAAIGPTQARKRLSERSDENNPVWKPGVSAFIQALTGLGWTDGRNVRMDLRWYGDDINRVRALAQELVGLQPDIILVTGTPATVALQQQTRTIPIVFAGAGDPVANGLVARLDRPSGNVSIGTAPHSLEIIKSKSRSCTTTASSLPLTRGRRKLSWTE